MCIGSKAASGPSLGPLSTLFLETSLSIVPEDLPVPASPGPALQAQATMPGFSVDPEIELRS